jgi:hypothetical protein
MTTLMETLKTVAPLQMAAYSVLALAIAWVLWELLCLYRAVRTGTSIFPATIPTLFIFSGAIVGVELLHRSPLHLIWLFALSWLLGLIAIISPFVQQVSLEFLELLCFRSSSIASQTTPDSSPKQSKKNKTLSFTPPAQASIHKSASNKGFNPD